jgi:hypothetical protein
MTTAGRKKSTSLAHAGVAVTTGRKGIRRGDMARTFKLCFWYDETNMEN